MRKVCQILIFFALKNVRVLRSYSQHRSGYFRVPEAYLEKSSPIRQTNSSPKSQIQMWRLSQQLRCKEFHRYLISTEGQSLRKAQWADVAQCSCPPPGSWKWSWKTSSENLRSLNTGNIMELQLATPRCLYIYIDIISYIKEINIYIYVIIIYRYTYIYIYTYHNWCSLSVNRKPALYIRISYWSPNCLPIPCRISFQGTLSSIITVRGLNMPFLFHWKPRKSLVLCLISVYFRYPLSIFVAQWQFQSRRWEKWPSRDPSWKHSFCWWWVVPAQSSLKYRPVPWRGLQGQKWRQGQNASRSGFEGNSNSFKKEPSRKIMNFENTWNSEKAMMTS